MLFNEKGNTLERFINEVNSEDRNAISQFIHDFISWLKARLKGEKVSFKIVKLENRFAAVLRSVDNTNAQTNNTTNDGDVQYEFGDKKITVNMSDDERTYILKNTKIKLAEYDGNSEDLNSENVIMLKASYTSQANKILRTLGEKFGAFKLYSNENISFDFDYSKRSMKESVHKQGKISTDFYDFAKMLYIFDDVVKNAVPIEVHKEKYKGTEKENTNLKQGYVLLSAFKDGAYIIPVEMHVKEFNEDYPKDNKLYVSITLGKIKIEDKVKVQSSGQKAQLSNTRLSSSISLPELVSKINPDYGNFYKYLPEALLNKKQNESRRVESNEYSRLCSCS